jgi:hypothetical protein
LAYVGPHGFLECGIGMPVALANALSKASDAAQGSLPLSESLKRIDDHEAAVTLPQVDGGLATQQPARERL